MYDVMTARPTSCFTLILLPYAFNNTVVVVCMKLEGAFKPVSSFAGFLNNYISVF